MTANEMAGERNIEKPRQDSHSGAGDVGAENAGAARRESAVMRKARVDARGEIMTRSEVAELLRCSEPHVVALIEREGLPAFRLGKLWRFRRSEVLAWCQRRENGSRTA
jgi:excisionase family DNA binding protein